MEHAGEIVTPPDEGGKIMEHKIGQRITLEAVEVVGNIYLCDGCFFDGVFCRKPYEWKCCKSQRTDGKNIIYKEIKEE